MPSSRILHHGRRPRPVRLPKLRRHDVADLLACLLQVECHAAAAAGDDEQAQYLDGLCERAEVLALGALARVG